MFALSANTIVNMTAYRGIRHLCCPKIVDDECLCPQPTDDKKSAHAKAPPCQLRSLLNGGEPRLRSKVMMKHIAALALAGALTLITTMSFAQSQWNGWYCGPPRYDSGGVPYGPYCPYP